MELSILHLSDLHGATGPLSCLAEIPRPDVVVLSGDLTHFGQEKETQEVIDAVKAYFPSVLALHGNCDKPEVQKFLAANSISLHRDIKVVNNLPLLGTGGSLPCPGKTPSEYSEDMYRQWLAETYNKAGKPEKFILVTHQPPYGTKIDKAMKLVHTGSRSVREFIEQTRPLLCLCGHIHEAAGTDRIGSTLVVNPGPFKHGHYALIHLNNDDIAIQLK